MDASPNKPEKIKLDFKDSKYATGRRKTSIAKIWLKKGSGKIYVNGKNYNKDIFEWGKETLWWGRRVAACKAKIKNIDNNNLLSRTSEQIIETFDKR